MNHNETATPKPGDLVLVEATDDMFIPAGSYGVIIGEVKEKQQDPNSVVFNFTNPWWQKTQSDEIVNASGGPQREIQTKQLKATPERRDQEFLNFDGPWGQDAAKSKTVRVNVWKTDLTKR